MQGIRHSFFPIISFNHSATLICGCMLSPVLRAKPSATDCAIETAADCMTDVATEMLSPRAFVVEFPVCDEDEESGCGSNQLLWKS